MDFITVCDNEESEPVEVPIEDDDAVLYTTLLGQFPKACGLKYRPKGSVTCRAVKILDGKFYKPPEGWVGLKFICVFAKESDNKRKCDEVYENCMPKTKRLEGRKCTDLIVLNLGWKVDEDCLRKYFSQFGELVLVQVKRDRESNQSKGFAFIRFSEYESQVMCMAEEHLIDGRWCSVKVPFSKNEADKQEISKKVHVSYTSEEITMDDIRSSFEQFGYVTDIFIPKPFRNFAFVTFDSSDSVQSLIGQTIIVKGHALTVGSAVPKVTNANINMNNFVTNKRMGGQQMPMYGDNAPPFVGRMGWHNLDNNNSIHNSYNAHNMRPGSYNHYPGLLPSQHQQYAQANNRPDLIPTPYGAPPTDMGHNTAAMAALNILNNPQVVAAIVAAAANSNKTAAHHSKYRPHHQSGGI